MSSPILPEVAKKKSKESTEEMTLVSEQEKLEYAQKELDELLALR